MTYNLKEATKMLTQSGAYLARDMDWDDEVIERRVESWREATMKIIQQHQRAHTRIHELTQATSDMRGEVERLRILVGQLQETNTELLEYPELDPGWFPFVDMCKRWLKHYPADVFTGVSGDPGAEFIVEIRAAVEKLDGV